MDLMAMPMLNPNVVLREEFDDWAVLYNPDTADAVGINPVGVAVWKQIDGKRTVAQIISHVRATYDEVPDTVEAEIIQFVQGLAQKGLIGFETTQPA